MGVKWGGLQLGDVVSPVARTRRMIVTDMDLEDRAVVTCAWKDAPKGPPHEKPFRISTLLLVKRASSSRHS